MIPRALKIIELIKSSKFFYFCTRIDHRDERKYIDGTAGKKHQQIKPRIRGKKEDKNLFYKLFLFSPHTTISIGKWQFEFFRLISQIHGLQTIKENYWQATAYMPTVDTV